jgi:hypothetical protein
MSFGDWLDFVRDNHFQIDRPYWWRSLLISLNSLSNSPLRLFEERVLEPKVQAMTVVPPLFILGHARSGTTYLYNMLALDPRFASPNVYEAYYPHTFLSTEGIFARIIAAFLPRNRPMDAVALRISAPAEDEWAHCIATGLSPYMRYIAPRRAAHYDRYMTFRDVPPQETARWKRAFLLFLKKLTWKYQKPLVLKSPPHTCRLRLLLEMFPDARFIHIHRNPYHVFQSTRHLNRLALRSFTLQRTPADVDERIVQAYQQMYDSFFAERHLIPAGRLHDLSFERLEKDPKGEVRAIYEALDLPSFAQFERPLERYIESLINYRKNQFPEVASRLRTRLRREWHRNFEEWGYSLS